MKNWKIVIILILISALFAWGKLSHYVHGTASKQYNQFSQNQVNNNIPIDSILNKISKKDISDNFPFALIAENINLSDYQKQKEILSYLENLDSNQFTKSQEYVFISLSDTLLKKLEIRLNFEDLNVLTSLTNEVTSLFYYSKYDLKNQIFYEALFDYWMQLINSKLETIANNNYWKKYSFEYKYISTVCQQFNYNPSTGLNSTEKVLDNLVENKYGYLFNRFILRTSTFQKIIGALFLSISIISLTFSVYYLIKKIRKS